MNLPADQIERLQELGYTDSEARFLYIVAIHSGYFTLRQFLSFAQARRGKRSTVFAQKLLRRGHARLRDYLGAGSVFHLFSRTLYGQIEKDNLRNRRAHSFDFIRTRLVLLDFILENQEFEYFETEQAKVSFFYEKLGVPKDVLPAKLYEGGPGTRPAIRYFVDKFPIFLAPPVPGTSAVVTFSFVDSGSGTLPNFVAHLRAYQALLQQLKRFRFVYIAPKDVHFRKAAERFHAVVKRALESGVSSEILRYFEVRKKWESREYVIPVTEDFEFLNRARHRFNGERFERLYEAWRRGEKNERDLEAEFSEETHDRTVFFDTYLVRAHRSPLAVDTRDGERCVKDTDHLMVHGSVHLRGERKFAGA